MGRAASINSVCDCNRYLCRETLNPSVSIIDLSETGRQEKLLLECYSVVLKESCCTSACGCRSYDYSCASVFFNMPGKTVSMSENDCGKILVFNKELLDEPSFGKMIEDCSFFRYRYNEALHISLKEMKVLLNCLSDIENELKWGTDPFSHDIVNKRIELFFTYCKRFYFRQFITRHDCNEEKIRKAKDYVENYFHEGKAAGGRLPDSPEIASVLCLSEDYFADMLRHETGKSVSDFVQLERFRCAKEMLLKTDMGIGQIAGHLGWSSVRFFSTLFKKLTGLSPQEYRIPHRLS